MAFPRYLILFLAFAFTAFCCYLEIATASVPGSVDSIQFNPPSTPRFRTPLAGISAGKPRQPATTPAQRGGAAATTERPSARLPSELSESAGGADAASAAAAGSPTRWFSFLLLRAADQPAPRVASRRALMGGATGVSSPLLQAPELDIETHGTEDNTFEVEGSGGIVEMGSHEHGRELTAHDSRNKRRDERRGVTNRVANKVKRVVEKKVKKEATKVVEKAAKSLAEKAAKKVGEKVATKVAEEVGKKALSSVGGSMVGGLGSVVGVGGGPTIFDKVGKDLEKSGKVGRVFGKVMQNKVVNAIAQVAIPKPVMMGLNVAAAGYEHIKKGAVVAAKQIGKGAKLAARGVKNAGKAVWKGVKNAGKAVGKGVKKAGKAGKAVWKGVKNAGKAVWKGVKNAGKAVGKGVKKAGKAGKAVWKGVKNAGKAVGKGVKKAGKAVGKAAKKVFGSIGGLFKKKKNKNKK